MPLADERILEVDVGGTSVLAIAHLPDETGGHGVLIVPGAPQYRVGPHRLFVDLARQLAHNGVAVMRIDRRGYGDHGGEPVAFEAAGPEIEAALAAFKAAAPGVRSFGVLGLCDGASAALLHAARLSGVDRLILLNPWVRGDAAEAHAVLGGYYVPRMLRWRRWLAVMTSFGRMTGALRGVAGAVLDALRHRGGGQPAFVEAMLRNWVGFPGRSLVVLSGRDVTAAEFDQLVRRTLTWRVHAGADVLRLKDADHTFSNRRDKARLAEEILAWLES
jgi:exosortase A-associated hydrolase 1